MDHGKNTLFPMRRGSLSIPEFCIRRPGLQLKANDMLIHIHAVNLNDAAPGWEMGIPLTQYLGPKIHHIHISVFSLRKWYRQAIN